MPHSVIENIQSCIGRVFFTAMRTCFAYIGHLIWTLALHWWFSPREFLCLQYRPSLTRWEIAQHNLHPASKYVNPIGGGYHFHPHPHPCCRFSHSYRPPALSPGTSWYGLWGLGQRFTGQGPKRKRIPRGMRGWNWFIRSKSTLFSWNSIQQVFASVTFQEEAFQVFSFCWTQLWNI